jgi:hypothetical protein
MKSDQLIKSFVILLTTFICGHASAAVYKCTTFDKQSNKQSIIYSDSPCSESVKQTVVDVQTRPVNNDIKSDDSALDLKITRAVLKRDFKLAKSLATSKEHWQLISMAESGQQSSIQTAPIVTAQTTYRDECTNARNDYESTARNRWRDEELIATKKTSMFAACGIAEPIQENATIVVGYPHRGIQSKRWVSTPYGPVVYHRPYNKHHDNHYSNHADNGGSLSIDYQSKHFGVRAQSSGSQQNTDIRQQFRTHNFASEQHSDIRQQFR